MSKLGEMLFEDGVRKGEEKKAIEIAKAAIKKGLSDELICELTELTELQVSTLKGLEKGREEQAIDIAIKAVKMGLDNEMISELTGFEEKEINLIRIAQSN